MWTSYDKRFCRESKVHLSYPWHFLHTEFLHQKEPTTRSQVWKKHLDVKITLRRIQLAKKCRKKKYDSIHDRYIRDKTFRKSMIEVGRSEKMIKEMDKLASEDHTYKANKEEIEFYRGNWWIHTNVAHFDSVPTRYKLGFKNALSTPEASRGQKETGNISTKFLILVFLALACKLVGVWFWALASEMVWPLIAQGNVYLGGSISICGKSLNVQKNLKFLSWINGLQLTAVYTVTDGWCKGNVSCTWYSRTFYDTQMATANCVHPHAQLEHAWAHCE